MVRAGWFIDRVGVCDAAAHRFPRTKRMTTSKFMIDNMIDGKVVSNISNALVDGERSNQGDDPTTNTFTPLSARQT